MPLVVGVDLVDLGACKVEARDADTGALVSSGRAPHPPTTPPRSEQDPAAWWDAFNAACGLAGVRDPAAISVAGQQHGLVVLDDRGEVLRPAKLWNDTESAPDADALVDALGAQAWADACGSVPVAGFTITKAAWLRRCEPDVFARVTKVCLPHDWLTLRLTGSHVTDRGDASGSGWWSPASDGMRLDLLALVDADRDWTATVPGVLGPTASAGTWGGAVVGPGTGDNMAAALGLGLRPGDLALSLGTSGTAFRVADVPSADPTGAVCGFADASGRFLPLVCTLNATKVIGTVARLLGVTEDELAALALAAPPAAGGVVLVPHLDGERTPNRPAATGTLTGLRSDATREQVARAAFEGVVCNLLAGADRLPAGDGRVFLVGGGARSTAFCQIVADLVGQPVLVPTDDESPVARGAAAQAAAVLHGFPIDAVLDAWAPSLVTTVDPSSGVDGAAIRQAYEAAAE